MLFADLCLSVPLAGKSVSNNERRSHDGVVESVCYCGVHMVDGILSRARIERVRVCDERLASTSFYLIDNLPDGRRAYIRVVTLFAKVKLDRRWRVGRDKTVESCCVEQLLDASDGAPVTFCLETGEIYLACHDYFSLPNSNKFILPILTPIADLLISCLLYTSPSPRDGLLSRMPS